jgi:hypothetical protein
MTSTSKKKQKGSAGRISVVGVGKGVVNATRTPAGATTRMPNPAPGRVRLRTKNAKHEIVARLDDEPAILVPQVPRIEQLDVPWRAAQSQWVGQAPGELTLPLVLDAYPTGSIEADWSTLESMARPVYAGRADGPPSPLQVSGTVPGTNRWWQITGILPGDAIWMPGGYRARQHVVLTLTQWLPVGATDTRGRENQRTATGARKKRQPVTVKKGDTLETIARTTLGTAKRWKDIAKLNKHENKKPRRSPRDLRPGERLQLPQD